jgi:FO synthase
VLTAFEAGEDLDEDRIVTLFGARGPEVGEIAEAADRLRSEVVGDDVTYVVNRNINYTNVCTFKCRFCGFSKGPLSLNLRGTPYLLTLDDIAERAAEGWARGATEVTLQGGIHPNFDGDYYLDVTRAVKEAVPEMHIHGFTALEVTEGAGRLGEDLEKYLGRLVDAGLASLPGTAAEVLDDEVRAELCPDKINTEEWLEGPSGGAPCRAAIQRDHHVWVDRATPPLGPTPDPHPRPAGGRPEASPSLCRCRSSTWPAPSTCNARPAGAPPGARSC